MDCTPFIRNRRTLAAWIAVPLLLLLSISVAVRWFHDQQMTSCARHIALTGMIPNMENEAEAATRFLDTWQLHRTTDESVQDLYIALLNKAALSSEFEINTIYLNQNTLDPTLDTAEAAISLTGSGSCRQIATFLSLIQEEDPMLMIKTLNISPSGRTPDDLLVESQLIRIYTQ